ncbi:unnamed protein product, partial [Prorocentrum cordatum]
GWLEGSRAPALHVGVEGVAQRGPPRLPFAMGGAWPWTGGAAQLPAPASVPLPLMLLLAPARADQRRLPAPAQLPSWAADSEGYEVQAPPAVAAAEVGESRLRERDQLYGHVVKVSQSKLRRLRAKRIRYRLWSTARGPDLSCLVRAGICAPRYYRNFCSDDSEEEEWVRSTADRASADYYQTATLCRKATCGTQTDMDAVELAGNSLCSHCSDCGTQTDPCVHIACGTQTDRCVLFVGEEEKEECHRVRADRGDASLRMKRYCFKRVEAIESSKLRTSELHATNGSCGGECRSLEFS